MHEVYKRYIEHFKNRKRPDKILDDTVLSFYSERGLDLPTAYIELINDYSVDALYSLDPDTIANIYLDSALLSDNFILFCLPRTLEKVLEYEDDCILFNRLNRINFDNLCDEDSKILCDLLKELQSDENIELFGIDEPIVSK